MAAAGVYACVRGVSYDHREKIAIATLFPGERADNAALDAAISAKFLNQPAKSLVAFAESLNGICGTANGTVQCSFPVKGTVCVGDRIMIVGDIVDDLITRIKANSYSANC